MKYGTITELAKGKRQKQSKWGNQCRDVFIKWGGLGNRNYKRRF